MFVKGREYKRSAIHDKIGGNRQSGISVPKETPVVLVISGDEGSKHGYDDWCDDLGVWHYFGQGKTGDMTFGTNNTAVRDHTINGRELHLFRQSRKAYLRYEGQYVCTEYEYTEAPDTNDELRQAIVFSLVPFESVDDDSKVDPALASGESRWDIPMAELRALAAERATVSGHVSYAQRKAYHRSAALKAYVRRRANGNCEGCGDPAPFISKTDGKPYLEPHHTTRLADGGPDHPGHVIALCPDCHRRVHHGLDGSAYNDELIAKLKVIEGDQARSTSPIT